jgi:hypothetical protein
MSIKNLINTLESVYMGSFASINRNFIFWILIFYNQQASAGQFILSFAVLTLIKGLIETPSYSLISTDIDNSFNFSFAILSTIMYLFISSSYILLFHESYIVLFLLIINLIEVVNNYTYAYMIKNSLLHIKKNNYVKYEYMLYIALVGYTFVFSNEAEIIYTLIHLSVLVLLAKFLLFMKIVHFNESFSLIGITQKIQLSWGFYIATVISLLISNLYKFSTSYYFGDEALSSIYAVMSLFIIFDMSNSAIKSKDLSLDKNLFLHHNILKRALYISSILGMLLFFVVIIIKFIQPSFYEEGVYLIIILLVGKVLDGLKGYIKSSLYIQKSQTVYLRIMLSIFSFMFVYMLFYNVFLFRVEYLIFSISILTFIMHYVYWKKYAINL